MKKLTEWQPAAEAVSLSLSGASLVFSFMVLYYFLPPAIEVVRKWWSGEKKLDHTSYMILGISVSFIGKFTDNGFWAIPWSASYIDHPNFLDLFNLGVWFNIPDRQLTAIIAGAFHLKGIWLAMKKKRKANPFRPTIFHLLILGILLGSLHILILNSLR